MKDGLYTVAGTALAAIKAFAFIAAPALVTALIVTLIIMKIAS